MRIVSGSLKGIRFSVPKKFPSRPTTDFAKEALFNILHHSVDFEAIRVLDLFAGTGNISYEFASRGVKDIRSVDQNQHCIKFIKNTLTKHNLNAITPILSEVLNYLKSSNEDFDLIFADPPYDYKDYKALIQLVVAKKCFQEGGLFILEHGKEQDFSNMKDFSYLRNYGGVHFSFFEINDNE